MVPVNFLAYIATVKQGTGGGVHSDFAQSCGKSNISILGSQISMSLIVPLQTPPQHIKKRLCILLNSLLLKIECVGNLLSSYNRFSCPARNYNALIFLDPLSP